MKATHNNMIHHRRKGAWASTLRLLAISVCCVAATASCDDWLDVTPKTNIEEEDLFRNEQGFKEALTGIYITMGNTSLYGREMTYGFIDQLAQRYVNSASSTADYDKATWYTFPSTRTEAHYTAFWSGHYNLIANINNLLANIDERGDVITTDGYRDLIKGEALGLRSFLYLDLLRMFGPIYKDNPTSPAIPYRTRFDRDVRKLMPANQVCDSLIASLKEAESLLADDPMNISFPASGAVGGDQFLCHRFNRMNKYAVKAVMARAYLWKGDKANALLKAREVIDARKQGGGLMFSLITDNTQDKIGSTELLFSLSMDSETFADRVAEEFQITNWNYYIVTDVDRLYKMWDVAADGQNDMRLKDGTGFSITTNGAYTLKYRQEGLLSPLLKDNMPLVRLPEMYYIVTECTDDMAEAANMLSIVRSARGVEELDAFATEKQRTEALEKEYRKEFYAEGQLWFFYKRHAYKTFLFCPVANMSEANYRFAIPDDETVLGNIN